MEVIKTLSKILALPLVLFVYIYQITLSPDHGWLKYSFPNGYCKFHPTCSMYTLEVLKKDGLFGLPKIAKRVVSCNPLSLGGIDYPYPTQK